MKIVGFGMSGLIGGALGRKLTQRHDLVLLKRGVDWDARALGPWAKRIDGADAVINLSGEPIVGKRWTAGQKKAIRDSRVLATRVIVEAIAAARAKPKALLNASATGFYGARDPDEVLTENSPAGEGFLADVCREWERTALRARDYGVRTVCLRTSPVLAREGGMLKKMLPPFRAGLGGPLGSGRQIVSWIHIEDEEGAILKCLEDVSLEGPVNLASPNPVPMKEFTRTLARALHRPAFFKVPAFALKILLGEMADMLVTGQKVLPEKLLRAGYVFNHPILDEALRHAVQSDTYLR
ncbi:MAG: TIGR01777 family protein [Candidatus Omnitrophica bacterium]|nr:TIGR01777 family protein [Candidatus Omnitrophota bacterium]